MICGGGIVATSTNAMEIRMYQFNDGGRAAAGYKGKSGDCGVRAMSIACEMDYKAARKLLKEYSARGKLGSKAIASGIYKEDMDAALRSIGWAWVSAPKFEGRKARYADLPKGRHIAQMARHYAAVVDGVLLDSWDSSSKMVYGYWTKE